MGVLHLRRHSPEPRLEMTPLIDVVFLLLTFFIMALVLMVRAELLNVRLPTITAGTPARPEEAVTVAIDVEGRVFVDGEPTMVAEVVERVRDRREARPDARLLIAVDEGGRNESLLGLLNELARSGLTDFAIVGRRPDAPTGGPR